MKLLFVCYGNICRSPMAEGLAKKLLGGDHYIDSAGTGAHPGGPAAAEAVIVMRERGIDISGHRSKNIRELRPEEFDLTIALSRSIKDDLLYEFPGVELKARLWPIPDPIGCGLEIFRRCADQIETGVLGLIESIE